LTRVLEKYLENGSYRRAKWLFESITYEILSSDTDFKVGINLHNSVEDYLNEKNLSISKNYLWTFVAINIVFIIYLTLWI
jgi:hypothetical protein